MTGQGFVHDALFFDSDDTYVETLGPFLREGIAQGCGTAVAGAPERNRLLRESLGTDGDAVTFLDNEGWYVRPHATIAGWQRVLDDILADGKPSARLVGEVHFGATEDQHVAWTRYESALNEVFARSPAWVVCPYDLRALPEFVLEHASHTHPTVWDAERMRMPSDHYVEPSEFLARFATPRDDASAHPLVALEIDGNLSGLRKIARDAALAAGLSRSRVEGFALAVNEIATNAVRHGREPRRLRIWQRPEELIVEMSNAAGSIDPLAVYQPPAALPTGQMGLWLVGHLTDAMTIASDGEGTTVRFAFRR